MAFIQYDCKLSHNETYQGKEIVKNTLLDTYDDFDDKKFLSNVNHYVKTKEFKKFITSSVFECTSH